MGVVYDKLLGEALLHNHVKLVSSDPASGADGDMIINTTTDILKMWYDSQWNVIKEFTITIEYLLMETGDFLLQENGDKIIL